MSVINTPGLQRMWQDAQVNAEWATTRLWEHIFRSKVFRGDEWAISSQQPPTSKAGDLRRVDLVAEVFVTDKENWKSVLFVEAKRADSGPAELQNVEYQAFTACVAYLEESRRGGVCALTCFGGRARVWLYERGDDYLTPWVPDSQYLSSKTDYIEINSESGSQIMNALKYIRDRGIPTRKILRSRTSPRPRNAVLPSNWHDDEVARIFAGTSAESSSSSTTQFSQSATSSSTPKPPSAVAYSQNRVVATEAYDHEIEDDEDIMDEDILDEEGMDEDISNENDTETQKFVQTWRAKDKRGGTVFNFLRPDGKRVETEASSWKAATIKFKGTNRAVSVYTAKSGIRYFTSQLGFLPGDPRE